VNFAGEKAAVKAMS